MVGTDQLPAAVVIAALQALGLAPLYAQRAAGDSRISWTETALEACSHDIDTSTMRKPAHALWSTYLQHGQLPPLPYTPPAAGETVECPACHGDARDCGGMCCVPAWVWDVPCWSCGQPLRVCRGRHPVQVQEEAA